MNLTPLCKFYMLTQSVQDHLVLTAAAVTQKQITLLESIITNIEEIYLLRPWRLIQGSPPQSNSWLL